jgi:hypothetical protein
MREANKLFRRSLMQRRSGMRIPKDLRGDPILAKAAMKIAAQHAKAIRRCTRSHMKEGLFLNRVALSSGDISERNLQNSVFVEANPAYAGGIRRNETSMAASEAAQTPVFQGFE